MRKRHFAFWRFFSIPQLFVDDAEINKAFETGVPTLIATLTAEYEADVDILSAQLNWQLD